MRTLSVRKYEEDLNKQEDPANFEDDDDDEDRNSLSIKVEAYNKVGVLSRNYGNPYQIKHSKSASMTPFLYSEIYKSQKNLRQ